MAPLLAVHPRPRPRHRRVDRLLPPQASLLGPGKSTPHPTAHYPSPTALASFSLETMGDESTTPRLFYRDLGFQLTCRECCNYCQVRDSRQLLLIARVSHFLILDLNLITHDIATNFRVALPQTHMWGITTVVFTRLFTEPRCPQCQINQYVSAQTEAAPFVMFMLHIQTQRSQTIGRRLL